MELGALAMGEIEGACKCQDQQSAWSAHDTGVPESLLKLFWAYMIVLTAALAYDPSWQRTNLRLVMCMH